MTKLNLLLAAKSKEQARWAKEHLYVWLVLMPLMLGVSYWGVYRTSLNAQTIRLSTDFIVAASIALVFGLVALSLSRATSELYHLGRPEALFETMPLETSAHFQFALLTRFSRTLIVALIAVIARYLLNHESLGPLDELLVLPPFAFLLAIIELLAALTWAHWSRAKEKFPALLMTLVLVGGIVINSLLLAFVIKPNRFAASLLWPALVALLFALALYFIGVKLHRIWRASDYEAAKRIWPKSRVSLFQVNLFERLFGQLIAAQLKRDLQLTWRGFSSAVYVAVTGALLWLVVMVGALWGKALPPVDLAPTWFNGTWLPEVMAAKFACILGVVSLAALTPILVAYQLPHLWLERAVGNNGFQLWQAKLWYARLVSLPAPFVFWLAACLTGGIPLFYVLPLLLECLLFWLLASSLIGGLAFEIPDRPGLALLLMVVFGGAFSLFGALLWPVGIFFYLYLLGLLTDRGRHRARYWLMMGEL